MNSIFFYSNHLEFFFKERTFTLEIIDNFFLPFSKRFLYSIYHHRRALKAPKSMPQEFLREYNPERMKVTLILNLNGSFFFFPIRKIHAIHDGKENIPSFRIYTTCNEKLYNKLKQVTKKHIMFFFGSSRTASAKGAIIYGRKEEENKEALETTVGLLILLTPEDIKKEYM